MPNADHRACPTCRRPYDDDVLDDLARPDETGSGPTLQAIVDRLAKRSAKERYRVSEGYTE